MRGTFTPYFPQHIVVEWSSLNWNISNRKMYGTSITFTDLENKLGSTTSEIEPGIELLSKYRVPKDVLIILFTSQIFIARLNYIPKVN